jgi:amino acid adenylation domain-containing protein
VTTPTDARLKNLSPERTALLERLQAARTRDAGRIERADRSQPIPLSFAQQRLWLIDQLAPGNSHYVIPVGLRLRGALDVTALAAACAEIVVRHEALRTRFGMVDDRPVQIVDDAGASPLEVTDLRHVPASEHDAHLRALLAKQIAGTCDLRHGPLFRLGLVVLGEADHALLLAMHHIVGDAWSMAVVARELGVLYEAFAQGKPSPLAPPPLQYADFAAWQRRTFDDASVASHIDYWRRQLSGLEPLDLPHDRARPASPAQVGGREGLQVSGDTADGLRALARAEDATLFMALAASLHLTLARFAGSADVAIGTPVADRRRPELESLVGFFVNTLVLRARVEPLMTGRELLRAVRDVCFAAHAHQTIPFERVVEELQPQRSANRTPLFDVLFAFQNVPGGGLQLPGVAIEPLVAREHVSALYDLTFELRETTSGIGGELAYAAELFDAATAGAFARFWERAARELATHPDRPVFELWSHANVESSAALESARRGVPRFAADRVIHELIQEQATHSPTKPAVVCGDDELTYGELDRRANQLAQHLVALGVGPETRVAVCLERGVDLIVAILATLKAGGGYVPLDPEQSAGRVALMLDDCGARVLVSRRQLLDALALDPPANTRHVCLDEDAGEIASRPSEAPASRVDPDGLAYVMYTSGSTGRPKGVAVSHANLASSTMARRLTYSGNVGAYLLSSSHAFDSSVAGIFWTLSAGGLLVLVPAGRASDVEWLAAEIERRAITHFVGIPSLYEAILNGAPGGGLASLRLVIVAGERCLPRLIERHWALIPSARLHNEYGPTEATVWSSVARCDPELGEEAVSIGRPIANSSTHILDERFAEMPIGAVGEVFVGGAGIARGYVNQPALTAQRFVPDPFGDFGARLYRTGDRGRWHHSGVLEFVGRVDEQIKIRGVRIELSEVEAALRRMPGIADVAVVARPDSTGAAQLIAYAVGAAATLDPSALRRALARELPAPMIPAHIVRLAELPRTATGKLDRRALLAVDVEDGAGEFTPPSTPTEELVGGIWCTLLRQARVSADDDFFALGGHSLLATQVISQVRQVLDVEVPLRQVFDTPRLADFAAAIDGMRAGADGLPLHAVSRDRSLPLSFAQQRLWFVDQLEPGSAVFNQPVALRLRGPLDADALERTLGAIVARHEVLRTRIVVEGGEPRQVADAEWAGRLDRIDVRSLEGVAQQEAIRRQASTEANTPFDLSVGPVFRARLLLLGVDEHVLLVTMHHIVSDGWSMGVLVREVGACYDAFVRGESPRLEALPVQYADYAVWQRESLSGDVLAGKLAYWRRQLADAPQLELPTDRPRPPVPSRAGASVPFDLSPELVGRLRAVARDEGATLFMTLLAGFNLLLARYAGQDDVAIGTDVANRTRAEIAPLIGFFVNQLVLRTRVPLGGTVRELVQRSRDVCLEAYAHQDLPFERVVEELNPARTLDRAPLFDVKLLLQNVPSAGRSAFSGIDISTVEGGDVGARLDLVLHLIETGDGVHGRCAYASALFDRTTIERLVRRWTRLLEGMAANPARPLADLLLLEDADRSLLDACNATARTLPAGLVSSWLDAQAAATPNATAVRHGAAELTYAALHGRANQFARHLRDFGVGPEVRVAIFSERTPDLLVAILAVMKAGGAYVPLDPAYPAVRLQQMLDDAGASVVLTGSHLAARLPSTFGHVLCLDEEQAAIEAHSPAPVDVATDPAQAAYVLYTSGSTGRPKGVVVTHGGLANYLSWAADAYDVRGGGAPLHSSIAFDLTVTSLFLPLLRGGAITLVPDGNALDALRGVLSEEPAFDILKVTPSHLQALADMLDARTAAGVARAVVIGGEALTSAHLAWWREHAPRTRFFNEYGPTETVVGCCIHEIARVGAEGPIEIGRPVANTRVYVLDAFLTPSALGAFGEIYVAGAGVARGYQNNPAATAERFVPDPFDATGGRLYRTGDVGRWRTDGQLEYRGRADDQVKIRGHRVEPGEVEAVIRQMHGVADVAVVARPAAAGLQLVAYVVAARETNVDATALLEQLAAQLPPALLPARIVSLDMLPLTANGKVDRRALPAPAAPVAREDSRVAQSPTEEALSAMWTSVLGVERIGLDDDFFALGGHSLLATQVVAQVRTVFGVDVSLRQLFEAPTVSALARAVESARRASVADDAPPLVARADSTAPLSFAQQRLWLTEHLEPGRGTYVVPSAVRLRGPLDAPALSGALDLLVDRHGVLRTRFSVIDNEPVQIVAPPGVSGAHEAERVRLELLDYSALAGDARLAAIWRVLEEEARTGFDLSRGPLLRAKLVRASATDHVLLLTMHHIVSDGRSMDVLVRELTTAYAALARGETPVLPALPVQYADYAAWQRGWLTAAVAERQLDYWRRQLAGVAPLGLSPDRVRPAVLARVGARVEVQVPAEVGAALGALGQTEGATLFMVLAASFQVVLARHTGQEDIALGTAVANRDRAELEPLIGFFVNQVVLRTDLAGDPSFREVVRRVRQVCLDAYAHQDVSFEQVVEAVIRRAR